MAIERNDCPLLEYCTDQRVYHSPEIPGKTLPRLCLVTFFDELLDAFVEQFGAVEIDEFSDGMNTYPIYMATVEGYDVCVTFGAVGSTMAAMQADYLYGHGAQMIVACDSCSALDNSIELGTIIIPVRALRAEGASYHYLKRSRYMDMVSKYTDCARNILTKREISFVKCSTWTTDAPYRESIEMVDYRLSEGYRVVDLHCSAMAAVAKARDKGFTELMYVENRLSDNVYDGEMLDENFMMIRRRTFLLTLEILCHCEEKVMHIMDLQPEFFDAFRRGDKSIEIRCLDEKRRNVRVGDMVQLQKNDGSFLQMKVVELIACESFEELYDKTSAEELGFAGVSKKDFIIKMCSIYSPTRVKALGVIGIRLEPM